MNLDDWMNNSGWMGMKEIREMIVRFVTVVIVENTYYNRDFIRSYKHV